ncbi:MAG TPA: hypothetical protein VFM05_11815 [Candidatus Saccharimonadales bacterium]|nr:hypothetical protein [Candidatus Saccharimonadales bacterium]
MSFHLALLLEDITTSWTKWMGIIAATLGVVALILQIIGQLIPALKWLLRRVLKPAWNGPVQPLVKLILAMASIIIPNAAFIGFWTFIVAGYYSKIGRPDYLVTNPIVFWRLLAWQTALVSIYSFLWAILLYPKIKTWFVFWKKSSLRKVKTHE